MSKRRAGAPAKTSPAAGELTRHLAAIGLDSTEAYRAWCRANGFREALDKCWHERRTERERADALRKRAAALAAMAEHFRALGAADEAEYYAWCRAHAFAEKLEKRPRQRAEELLEFSRERSAAALSAARRLDRRMGSAIGALAGAPSDSDAREQSSAAGDSDDRRVRVRAGAPGGRRGGADPGLHPRYAGIAGRPPAEPVQPGASPGSPLYKAICEAFDEAGPDAGVRAALQRLVVHCERVSRLLALGAAIAHLGDQPGNTYTRGLLELARRHRDWRQPPEQWRPDSHSARRQFGQFARHLMAAYDVPAFLDAAWLEGGDARAARHRDWYLHIGNGRNIRTADIPIRLTRRAAHLFLQAPRDMAIEAALRWAQVRALGGDERLARALLGTRLAELQEDEPFWQSVIFFFINNPMLDVARVGEIVDFVHNRRFVPAEIQGPDGVPALAVPEPAFSMKGRTGLALLRRVEEWHRELARETRRRAVEWPTGGIAGHRSVCREPGATIDTEWTIEELLSSRALQ